MHDFSTCARTLSGGRVLASASPRRRSPLHDSSDCALCRYFGLDPRRTTGAIGLRTSITELIGWSAARLDEGSSSEAHVLVPVCPEHVIDVYRARIPGVTMAWQMTPASVS